MVEAATGRPSRLARWWAAPLWLHAVALAILLTGAVALIGTEGMFSSDEAAPLLQARLLDEGRGWIVANPLPQLDPTGERFFLAHSDGGPDEFAPYGKHPLYPLALVPITGVAGTVGAVGLSALGTLLAAGSAAALAGLVDRSQRRAAFWVAGLLSPLFFDGALIMAHSLGAACCGWLTWLALTATDAAPARRVVHWAGAAALVVVAVLLRSEAVLFAAAAGFGFAVVAVRHRRVVPGLTGGVLLVSAGAALLGERAWYRGIFEAASAVATPIDTGGGLAATLAGRLQALGWTFVAPTGRTAGPVVVVALVVVFLFVIAAVRLRRSPPAWNEAAGLLVAAAVVATVGVLVTPDAISGLLVAFPFLTFGLVSLRRSDLEPWPVAILAGICLTFAVLVVATSYSFGGAAEWGGRFLALALPLAVPVVLQPVLRLWSAKRPAPAARRALVGLVAASVALTVIGVRTLDATHARTTELAAAYAALVTAGDVAGAGPDLGDGDRRPIVVSTDGDLGRFSWRSYDDARGITVPAPEIAEALEQLAGEPGSTVVLVGAIDDEQHARIADAGWSVARRVTLSTGEELLVIRHGS